MTKKEAMKILNPITMDDALAPYAHDCSLRCAIVAEAMAVAKENDAEEAAANE